MAAARHGPSRARPSCGAPASALARGAPGWRDVNSPGHGVPLLFSVASLSSAHKLLPPPRNHPLSHPRRAMRGPAGAADEPQARPCLHSPVYTLSLPQTIRLPWRPGQHLLPEHELPGVRGHLRALGPRHHLGRPAPQRLQHRATEAPYGRPAAQLCTRDCWCSPRGGGARVGLADAPAYRRSWPMRPWSWARSCTSSWPGRAQRAYRTRASSWTGWSRERWTLRRASARRGRGT